MATAKSFTDLADLYQTQVLVRESRDEQSEIITESDKQTVGGKQDIGDVKLEKKGGNEKVKKDLDTPTEEKKDASGKPENLKESKKMNKSNSVFDKVYNQIFNEDGDPFGTGDDNLDDTSDPSLDGDVAPEGEASTEEVIDPVALFATVCDGLEKLKAHFGITSPEDESEIVDLNGGDDLGDGTPPPVGEATEIKELPDSKGKSLQGKNNKVGGTKVNGAGKADASTTVGDGKLEKAPCAEKKFSGKDNKVKGSGPAVKGGDTSAFEG